MTEQEKLNRIYEVINFPYDDGDAVYSPVTIGDVLDWLDSQEVQKIDGRHPAQRSLLILWKSKRLPIDEQSDECIDYIYSLIK